MAYVNPTEVQTLTGEIVDQLHCNAASEFIDQNGIYYQEQTKTFVVEVRQDLMIQLNTYPINSIVSVFSYPSGNVDYKSSFSLFSEFDNPGMIKVSGFKIGSRFTITAKVGYVQIPANVKMVAAQIAVLLKKNPIGIQSENINGYSVTYKSDLSVQSLLKQLPRFKKYLG